mgnify:FL=1
MTKITIIAVDEARVPYRDELGRIEPGRFAGRDADGNAAAEEVAESPWVLRALRRGDLALATIAPAAAPTTEP